MQNGAILALCPNTAWQKTLVFEKLQANAVNRAVAVKQTGGGKGVNVLRVLRRLGLPAGIAGFVGGEGGRRLREEFADCGADDLCVDSKGHTRYCYTVIDQSQNSATELIEPSPEIMPEESAALLQLLNQRMPEFSALCIAGSLPPGLAPDFYGQITAMAHKQGVPVLLDAFANIESSLQAGLTMLKINRQELSSLSGDEDPDRAAAALMRKYPLTWLAMTDGAGAARLFSPEQTWELQVPRLPRIVSPIGAGDCAAAILTWRLSQKAPEARMPEYFAEALACASASCLTDEPSLFDPQQAEKILTEIKISRIDR
ncbi:MAG: hypothetical protein GX946_04335 [Oligosphaeraceae bacterium]|nr:hypothetical protein [Oligosphaeraceae bacterium]